MCLQNSILPSVPLLSGAASFSFLNIIISLSERNVLGEDATFPPSL